MGYFVSHRVGDKGEGDHPHPALPRQGGGVGRGGKMGFPILASYKIVLNDLTIQPLNDSTKLPVTANEES